MARAPAGRPCFDPLWVPAALAGRAEGTLGLLWFVSELTAGTKVAFTKRTLFPGGAIYLVKAAVLANGAVKTSARYPCTQISQICSSVSARGARLGTLGTATYTIQPNVAQPAVGNLALSGTFDSVAPWRAADARSLSWLLLELPTRARVTNLKPRGA
jgi:hypothetical protein